MIHPIVDLSHRWHHDYMRLVTYLLLRQIFFRSIFASFIVFSTSICLQLILNQEPTLNTAIQRGILFGTIIGVAWTTVRWRFFSGVQIIEGLGYPRWIVALLMGTFSASIILTYSILTPTQAQFTINENSINWRAKGTVEQIDKHTLKTKSQLETFDRISRAVARQTGTSITRYLMTSIPFGLCLLLLYAGKDDDLWQPILTTGITIVLAEVWCQAYV